MSLCLCEFLSLCIDESFLNVEVYSIGAGDVVWTGSADDLPTNYCFAELLSFDVPERAGFITLNIN